MKRSILFVAFLILALLISFPGSATQAAAVTQAIAPSSITTLTGGVVGAVGREKLQDQSGTADTPSKYVLFTTPAKIYKGYRQFILPTAIAPASITSMSVKVNYKGLPKASQRWSWFLYDWVAAKWIYIGDNASATLNRWKLLTFTGTSPQRFVSAGRAIRLLLQSGNATGDAKLDYESVNVTYTQTPSATPTITETATITQTPTITQTRTITQTPTVTHTKTVTPTLSVTRTKTATSTRTVTPTITPTIPVGATSAVYGDALQNGWEDWSWNATTNIASGFPVHTGTKAISVIYTSAGWGGLYFGRNVAIDISGYDTLRFWVHGGASGGQPLHVYVGDATTQVTKDITPTAGTWTMVDVPLTGLSSVDQIVLQNNTASSKPVFYVDDVSFLNSGAPTLTPTNTTPPGSGPALSVDAGAARHAISPYIYGMNFADETLASDLNLPVRRWGGNSTSRYNWQTNVSNTASDWYFENIPSDVSADQFIDQNNRTNTATLLTIPMLGWTPKDASPATHPYACGFKISKYGAQQDNDWQWDADCGNGVAAAGGNITGNNPTDTSKAITSSFVTDWITHLKTLYGTAATGGVKFYNLDNEPGLWSETQRDVHPTALTYDEITTRTKDYAAAIKAADPSALTLGPVEDGWCRYFFSAADNCNPAGSDRTAHGNVDYVAWYLAQMQNYETLHGVRILDYFDLHIYPQANGVYADAAGDAATQALRLRSTRQLWDPTYVDESWIHDMNWQGDTVQLLPRMHGWVNSNYPGTKLAISEYSWGAMGYLNGALAQADVLGIFGRESLDLATLWGPPTATQPGAYAFRMYLNYDGSHSTFGDTSVQSVSADQEKLAVYAAQRSSDSALTLMIINKTGGALTSTLSLSGFTPSGSVAQVWRYSNANLSAIQSMPDQAVSAAGFSATYPANSITLVVIPGTAP